MNSNEYGTFSRAKMAETDGWKPLNRIERRERPRPTWWQRHSEKVGAGIWLAVVASVVWYCIHLFALGV